MKTADFGLSRSLAIMQHRRPHGESVGASKRVCSRPGTVAAPSMTPVSMAVRASHVIANPCVVLLLISRAKRRRQTCCGAGR